jgi:putative ABC transport system permease protein
LLAHHSQSGDMLQNYLKVAFRTFVKNRSFSIINIAGLAIGISTCLLISLYVLDEVSFDQYHAKADRIYRVTELLHLPTEIRHQTVTSPPMAPALERTFPEVLKSVRVDFSSRAISYKENKFQDTKVMYADSALFQIFSFPMIQGNPDKALTQPYSIVLTKNAAKKYFGNEDPINKTMALSDTITLTVTGVIENIPSNSHFTFDAVISRATISAMYPDDKEDNWFNNGLYSYILLPENYDIHQLEAKTSAFIDKEMGADRKKFIWYDFAYQPLTSIHLHATSMYEIGVNGNIKYVYTFTIIAALVLLIACANYINLATAKSVNRAKELGMRKVIGAKKNQLAAQLLGESCLITLMAFIIAIAVVSAAIPAFNTLTGKLMSVGVLLRPDIFGVIVITFLLISVIAGGYPALLMASVSPLRAMKEYGRQGNSSGLVRKGLVVFQFSMSIILISSTMVIFQQMDFMRNRNLGMNKEQMMQIELPGRVRGKYKTIKEEMSHIPNVVSTSTAAFSFKGSVNNIMVLPEGTPETETSSESTISVDSDFLPTFGIDLIAGRNFENGSVADDTSAFIINEAAVKRFGWESPEKSIGKGINWGLGKKGKVIGVVRDFNYSSLHTGIAPVVIHVIPNWYNMLTLRISGENIPDVIKQAEAKWKQFDPEGNMRYSFMDEDFEKLYKAEEQTRTIVGMLATLAIFIACLGLFGLAAFIAEQRTKEIGIRKVLGANVGGIVALMSKDFLKLIAIAFVIAVPVGWYAASQWLTGFAYRTDITWTIFAIAGVSAASVALLTVSFQSLKASMMNPVTALRTE